MAINHQSNHDSACMVRNGGKLKKITIEYLQIKRPSVTSPKVPITSISRRALSRASEKKENRSNIAVARVLNPVLTYINGAVALMYKTTKNYSARAIQRMSENI